MAKLTLKCVKCETEETINLYSTIFGMKSEEEGSIQDVINEKGWKIIKVVGSEGYCCKKCYVEN